MMDRPADLAWCDAAPVSTIWPAQLQVLPISRDRVRSWLCEVGLPAPTSDDVVLATNEAVTNAVVHAYPPDQLAGTFDLTMWCEQGLACIAVQDRGRWRSAPKRQFGGYGLALMRALVHAVDIHTDGAGTRVTLRQPIPAGGFAG